MSLMKLPARWVFSTFDWNGCLRAAMNRNGGFSRRRLNPKSEAEGVEQRFFDHRLRRLHRLGISPIRFQTRWNNLFKIRVNL
jgi:hypothetical protein